MKCRQRTCRGDFEDGATGTTGTVVIGSPSGVSRPVEIAVGGAGQAGLGIGALCCGEAVQRGPRAPWGDFEDRPTATVAGGVGPSLSCPVEVAVGTLHQSG